jgi:septal ring factor EnvC (AmiA/AmiB activator)
VRYEQMNAMLLNEFLKEHKKVDQQAREIKQQRATISDLKKDMGLVTAQLKEHAAQIQKVSAKVEMSRRAPRVVSNR